MNISDILYKISTTKSQMTERAATKALEDKLNLSTVGYIIKCYNGVVADGSWSCTPQSTTLRDECQNRFKGSKVLVQELKEWYICYNKDSMEKILTELWFYIT